MSQVGGAEVQLGGGDKAQCVTVRMGGPRGLWEMAVMVKSSRSWSGTEVARADGREVAMVTEKFTKLQTEAQPSELAKTEVNSHHVKSNFRGALVPKAGL